MRILLLSESLGSGGAERQLVGLAILLRERGYQVKVISYYRNQFYEPLLRQANVEYEFCSELFYKWKRVFRLRKKLREYKPAVVISYLTSVNISLCLTRFLYRTRIIVSERTHTVHWNLKTRLRYLLYALSDSIVANSFSEAENIREHIPYLKGKIVFIPNFVDTSYFVPSGEAKRSVVERLILGVGRVIPTKNLIRFCEAIKCLIDEGYRFKVKWVGLQFNKVYLQEVRAQIEKCGLESVLELHDQTQDIRAYYQQADIFCLPSLYEGYPNVLCEAMSCGLSVACSDVCDNPRIVKQGKNGFLFDPTRVEDMTQALRCLLDMDVHELSQMGVYNRGCVLRNNSPKAFVESYIRLLSQIKTA